MSQSAKLPSQSQSRPKSTNELREFILDPKSSVKKFVEASLASNHPSRQQANHIGWEFSPNEGSQDLLTAPQLPQRRPHIRGRPSSYSNYTTEDSSEIQEDRNAHTVEMASHPKPSSSMDYANFANTRPSSALPEFPTGYAGSAPVNKEYHPVGPAPPPAEIPAVATLPAPRLYHRMITEYETIKAVFYAARMQPTHSDLSPLAAKLKSLCREIWSIRYVSAAEFPYNDATTEERITEWKTQFEYWNDVLEDLLDARYVQRTALEARESDWAAVAGLVGAVSSSKTAGAKSAAGLVEDEDEEPAAPAAKKKLAKAVATEGDVAPVKKKKATKKTATD